ncbi:MULTISPECIES: YajG family lipoprotein [Vibrio]|uniref:YajG family lipoprotein n=1 Tax=Vibrio qingdaonensis TaxID=2829491 RepID=A0A9X3CPU6_9VIBR|nr:YajG family lipoprotein [Vibrio qingdaonensis]MCW8347294.1 YajG family lipoprotein [Vibrio qingdaonensis]
MKKLVLAATIVLLAGCASPKQEQINFAPQAATSAAKIVEGKTMSLSSQDVRTAQYVALMDNGRANITPIHTRQNVRIGIENALVQQFSSQGYKVTVNSPNTVKVEIQEALVSVKHTVMENDMAANVVVELTVENSKGKLVKTYTGKATRSGLMSASNDDIETVLNDTVNLVLKEISNDAELVDYMKERF